MTFEQFADEMRPFHNHLGLLYDDSLVRLLGVGQDVCDLYYIVKEKYKAPYWATAVGHFRSLKDSYERYDFMDEAFRLNECGPNETFLMLTASDAQNWDLYKIKTDKGVIDEDWMQRYTALMDELHEALDFNLTGKEEWHKIETN